jgi:hypothetical protein
MSDNKPNPSTQPAQPATSRPAPPPYTPNKALIGYIEKGQNPPVEVRKRGQ